MAHLLAILFISGIPLVTGLHKILPNVRRLQSDDAAVIAEYHNRGLEVMARNYNSTSPFSTALEVLLEFMEEDGGLPSFSSEEMSAFATDFFSPDKDDLVDVTEVLMKATESGSSLVVTAVLHESLSNELEYASVDEFIGQVNDVAQLSLQEIDMVLASIATAVAEASEEFWTRATFGHNLVVLIVVVPDVVGAVVGYLLGGLIGAIVLGSLSSLFAGHSSIFDGTDYYC